jgi:diaminohydroxyphosphoribosylaminopyrimidine deaminase/5-amino-6-(5-phosphoribosylamino)uracil reductase
MREENLMRRALALAARAKGNTNPNPMVGAIVVGPDGTIVAEGWHERAGGAHAEAIAIERAGERARGTTLYVTLEPCDYHGRTPPCTEAIVRAGIDRIVVATEDADARVAGEGIRRLREAGLDVTVGIAADKARHLNRMYFRQRRTGLPFVTLKMAASLDGAAAAERGKRLQLTGQKAAAYVRSLRYEHDAVLIGVETAIVDNPQLTVRPFKERSVPFARIVVDSAARLPLRSQLLKDTKRASTAVAVTAGAQRERTDALQAAGAEIIVCRAREDGRVDLRHLLELLGNRGMLGVLCEGGPTIAGALLRDRLVQEFHLLIAPMVLGAAAAVPVVEGLPVPKQARLANVRRIGDDVLVVTRLDDETQDEA